MIIIIGGGSDVTKMLLLFSQHEVSCDCCKCTSFLSTFYFYSFKENTWIGWVITIIAPLHHNALRFFRQYTTSCSAGCIYAIYYQYSFMLIRASIIWQQLISMHISGAILKFKSVVVCSVEVGFLIKKVRSSKNIKTNARPTLQLFKA